jgi:suppressor of cytokine signaling 5
VSLAVAPAESAGSLDQDNGAVGRDPVIDLARFNPEDFPTEDCDELARLERAREMREGVEPPPGFSQLNSSIRRQLNQLGPDLLALNGLAAALFHSHVGTPPSGEQSLLHLHHQPLPELMPAEKVSFFKILLGQ